MIKGIQVGLMRWRHKTCVPRKVIDAMIETVETTMRNGGGRLLMARVKENFAKAKKDGK